MAKPQLTAYQGQIWGRPSILLIGIDWWLKRKAQDLESLANRVETEDNCALKQSLILPKSKEFRDIKALLLLYFIFSNFAIGWLFIKYLDPHIPKWASDFIPIFIAVFMTEISMRRLFNIEKRYIELWKSGGIASISGLVFFFPETAWQDRSLVSTERIQLLNSLLEMPNAVDLVSNADRKRLESYSATAYQLRKSRAKLELEIVRMQELLRDLKRTPQQVPGE